MFNGMGGKDGHCKVTGITVIDETMNRLIDELVQLETNEMVQQFVKMNNLKLISA